MCCGTCVTSEHPLRLLLNVSVMHSSCRAPRLWLVKGVTLRTKWPVHVHAHSSIFTHVYNVKPHKWPVCTFESLGYQKVLHIFSEPFFLVNIYLFQFARTNPHACSFNIWEHARARALVCKTVCDATDTVADIYQGTKLISVNCGQVHLHTFLISLDWYQTLSIHKASTGDVLVARYSNTHTHTHTP